MTAWGIFNFENEDARRWLAEFAEQPSRSLLATTFFRALDEAGRLDVRTGNEVLAAAEVLAAGGGFPPADWPELEDREVRVDAPVVRDLVDDELLHFALMAVERVEKYPSALMAHWEAAGQRDRKLQITADLKVRIARFPGFDPSTDTPAQSSLWSWIPGGRPRTPGADPVAPELPAIVWSIVLIVNWSLTGVGVLPVNGEMLLVNLVLNLAGFILMFYLGRVLSPSPLLRKIRPVVYGLTFMQTILNTFYIYDEIGVGAF